MKKWFLYGAIALVLAAFAIGCSGKKAEPAPEAQPAVEAPVPEAPAPEAPVEPVEAAPAEAPVEAPAETPAP
ncbi:MAG: hypothetical protein LBR16_05255 [Treponema sp.]|jgi:hypothetical protein|nr:hypothetical protein [Treponema sp.]